MLIGRLFIKAVLLIAKNIKFSVNWKFFFIKAVHLIAKKVKLSINWKAFDQGSTLNSNFF